MARIGRGNIGSVQAATSAGPLLGPHEPIIPPPPPNQQQSTWNYGVNQASDLVRRHYISTRRFPMQGWEQTDATLTSSEAITNNFSISKLGSASGFGFNAASHAEFAQKFARLLNGRPFLVTAWVSATGSPTDNLVVEIQTDSAGLPSGTVLMTSDPISGSSLTTTLAQKTFTFPTTVSTAGPVWAVIRRDGAIDAVNSYNLGLGTTTTLADGPSAAFASGVWGPNGTSTFAFSIQYWTTSTLHPLQSRFLGPRPPRAIDPLPSPQQQTIVTKPVSVAQIRREQAQQREPKSLLFPPATLAQPPPPAPLSVNCLQPDRLARRYRRLPFQSVLVPPTVLQTFASAKSALVTTRPRSTTRLLQPPMVVAEAALTYDQTTIRVVTVKSRPERTHTTLGPPTVLQTFSSSKPALVATRPRRTTRLLSPPTVVRVPSVEQAEQTIITRLERIRPRPTHAGVSEPTTLTVFNGPSVHLVATRPRHVIQKLSPPTVVRVPSVEQTEQTIKVSAVRTRPRATQTLLSPPTALQTFPGPLVHVVQTRPRPTVVLLTPPTTLQTFAAPVEERLVVQMAPERPRYAPHSRLSAPTVVRVPAVEQAEQTIRVQVVRTRPRPTVHDLFPPTVLDTYYGPRVETVRTRPQPTQATIKPPTVLLVPSVEQKLRTITICLTRTRPCATVKTLQPPAVVSRPPVGEIVTTLDAVRTRLEQKRRFPLQGWRQRLVRETGSTVTLPLFDPLLGPRPPQIVDPLPNLQQQTVRFSLDAVRTRVEQKRHFPLPGQRQRLVRETGSTVTCQMRDPLLGPRPPVVIDPLPTQQQQTISAALVAVRMRYEQKRHAAHQVLSEPTVVSHDTFQGPLVSLSKTRPRPTVHALGTPQALATFEGPRVALTTARPRPTIHKLGAPTALATFEGPKVSTTQTRPRPKSAIVRAPKVVTFPTFDGPAVSLATARPRPTSSVLAPPMVVGVFAPVVRVVLSKTRPRPTAATLFPPAAVSVPAVEQALRGIRVHLARIRPVRTLSELRRPTGTETFSGPSVSLTASRPKATLSRLAPPTVVFPAVVTTLAEETILVRLSRIRPRPTVASITPPAVVIFPKQGFVSGTDVPATSVEGFDASGAAVQSSSVEATTVQSSQVAGVDSMTEDVPATAVEGGPEEAGA